MFFWTRLDCSPVQGESPFLSTLAENAEAMGVDAGHMTYVELAQAVPPDYGAYFTGCQSLHFCRAKLGMKTFTYSEMLLNPGEAIRNVKFWLRGAGGESPHLGISLQAARAPVRAHVVLRSCWRQIIYIDTKTRKFGGAS